MGLRSVKRKGFFHILEVVIVAMLIFVILTQLYSVPKANQPWDAARLNVMSEDLIYSLEAKGVNWFDKAEVNDTLYYILPQTMGYSVSTTQDVRPQMRVAVICTGQDWTDVSALFGTGFTLNGVPRSIALTPVAVNSLDLSTKQLRSQYEAILFCGAPVFTPAQIDNLERYLSEGGGIVQFSDLMQTDVSGRRWYVEVMNLQWTDSVNSPSPRARFPYMDPDERRYPIQKIFLGVPVVPPPSFDTFVNFGDATETVYPADNAAEKIVVIQESYYVGGSEHEGKEVPLSTIDWGVNGSGRVAWMSRAPITGSSADENSAKKLLKSLVIWAASGKSYPIVGGTMSTSATASMRKAYGGTVGNMYEPVRIDLTVGYHY